MKLCSISYCKRYHDTKYKLCPTCRDFKRRSQKKRKRLASEKKVDEGFQLCKSCLNIKPVSDFQSTQHRRKKLTTLCKSCRLSNKKAYQNPTSKKGKCRQFWINWKKQQKCVDCGLVDERVIEADHVRGKKIYRIGDCYWWASHGGVEAMSKELEKCEPRCRFCHALKTKQRSDLKLKMEGRKLQPCYNRRFHEINMVKYNIGECKHCERKVTMETCCGFDFDHRNEETKVINIARIVYKGETEYKKHFKEEIPKCDLLCCNCHKIKTYY